MSNSTQEIDIERSRQEVVDELVAEQGPDWIKQYAPGTLGCHELLDRSILMAEMVEQSVLEHPACAQSREWFALAERAVAALNELYQRIGAAHLAEENH